MKRLGGDCYDRIIDLENINQADNTARLNKSRSKKYIKIHDSKREEENTALHNILKTGQYKTSEYSRFKVYEPKERIIYKLPYYPDRICHHTILNILKPFWEARFVEQTYSCIKDRGIHKCLKDVKSALKDKKNTRYCLELDIKKFYPSINHDILKAQLNHKIKCPRTITLLNELVDSVKGIEGYSEQGVPIGNWTSQYFGNITLTVLDYMCKQELKCKYYFRYADDIRVFSNNKNFLKKVLICIKFLCDFLKLKVKDNYRIVDMKKQRTDFLGYIIYRNHVKIRKRIKLKMFRTVKKFLAGKIPLEKFYLIWNSYKGWLKYCDAKHLLLKIQRLIGDIFNMATFRGEFMKITNLRNKCIHYVAVDKRAQYFRIFFIYKNKPYYTQSQNNYIYNVLNGLKTRNIIIKNNTSVKLIYRYII